MVHVRVFWFEERLGIGTPEGQLYFPKSSGAFPSWLSTLVAIRGRNVAMRRLGFLESTEADIEKGRRRRKAVHGRKVSNFCTL